MGKNMREKYLFYGGTIFLCVLLIVGLLSLLVGNRIPERKRPQPGGQLEEEKEEKEQKIESDTIRVVLKTNGFKEIEHTNVTLQAEKGLVLRYGEKTKECVAKEPVTIGVGNELFKEGTVVVEPKEKGDRIMISSLKRGYGAPTYRGKLELFQAAKGIVIVNELLMEEYLYAVVPSEMPASYEKEALKAQAVCARSYAVKQMRNYAYPEYKAHVDDSTSFQVYGNSKEKDSTIQAVNETTGEKVWHKNEVATTYYFSTSSGVTTTAQAWGSQPSDANAYLCSAKIANEEGAYEKNLAWYKWSAKIPEKLLGELISQNTKTEIGVVKNVEITKRGPGNVALQLVATGDKGSVTVDTENKIRRALGGKGYKIVRQDGKSTDSRELLPSAFFTIEKKGGDYLIQGGGFGHGIGMSQNGANEMAKAGKTYKEILKLFYQGVEIKK